MDYLNLEMLSFKVSNMA